MKPERGWKRLVSRGFRQTGQPIECVYALGSKKISSEEVPQVVREIDLHQQSLGHSRQILIVFLQYNNIGDEGCQHIICGKVVGVGTVTHIAIALELIFMPLTCCWNQKCAVIGLL